jgi:hypothetical protein
VKILFGPYGCVLSSLGISSNALAIKRQGKHLYRSAVELIARGYVHAGATLPTVNAFFLRSLLKEGFIEFYKELLALNLRGAFSAFWAGRSICPAESNQSLEENPSKIKITEFVDSL